MKIVLSFPSKDISEIIRPLNEAPENERVTLLFKNFDDSAGDTVDFLLAYKTSHDTWHAVHRWYTEDQLIADRCIGWVSEPCFNFYNYDK